MENKPETKNRNEYFRKYRAKNRKKINKISKNSYLRHREERIQRMKVYYEEVKQRKEDEKQAIEKFVSIMEETIDG